MKTIFGVLLTLAAVAAAAPGKHGCEPATYGCAKNPHTGVDGWQVCDTTRKWVVSSGRRPIFPLNDVGLADKIDYPSLVRWGLPP